MYYAITKYDEAKKPIMTSLYTTSKIHCVADIVKQNHFLLAISGWKNTDEMIKLYAERI